MAEFAVGDRVRVIEADRRNGPDPSLLGLELYIVSIDEDEYYPVIARLENDSEYAFNFDELEKV